MVVEILQYSMFYSRPCHIVCCGIIHRTRSDVFNVDILLEQRGHPVLQRGVQEGADGCGRGDGEEGEERHQEAVAEAGVPGGGGVPAEASQDPGRVNPRRLTDRSWLFYPQAKIIPIPRNYPLLNYYGLAHIVVVHGFVFFV